MKSAIIFFLYLLVLDYGAFAQTAVFQPNGVAINGYDPVAYFQENMPVAGKEDYTYTWNGATWQFASKENLEKFKQHPVQYAPQYGGHCAYGASRGYLAPTDPQAFTILENKLYLNYNLKVREDWMKDVTNRIKKADDNWEKELKNSSNK